MNLTSDQAGLFARVLADPADDTPRLVYADWLDDQGDGERAEFIRVQVQLAEMKPNLEAEALDCWCSRCQEARPLILRERELLEEFCRDDLAVEFGLPPHESLHPAPGGLTCPGLGVELAFRRGFVAEVRCDWPACRDHLDSIRREHPVERVVLNSMPDVFSSPRDGRENMIVDLDMDGGCLGTGPKTRDAILHALSKRWPNVAFELPPEPPVGDLVALHEAINRTYERLVRQERIDYSRLADLDFDVI